MRIRHRRASWLATMGLAVLSAGVLTRGAQTPAPPAPDGLTAVPGIRVGHFTMNGRPTGCTVVIADNGAVGGVDVRGGAPGTVETDLLRPDELVSTVNAIILAGGSAFGLEARTGVVKYLEEQKQGYRYGGTYIPIVPGAILFDLNVGNNPSIRPDANCGYQAAASASSGPIKEGSVGAGAGATVGKFGGAGRAMKGGVGTASLTTSSGLIVAALVAVNAAGSIVDPRTGQPVAGVRKADGKGLEDPFALVRRGLTVPAARENTTIGVIATNARLTKAQAMKIAAMAHDGYARTIVPSHTMGDGDTIFTLGTGTMDADVSQVGILAAEAMTDAVLRAVRAATGLPGFPAVNDIK